MAQVAHPSADTNNPGSFVNEAAGSTNLFQSIDEAVASDTDYIASPSNPASKVYVTKLDALIDPLQSTGHVVRFRYATDQAAGGESLDLTVELRQDYVSEAAKGALIASKTVAGISGATFVDDSFSLTGPQADSITDYTNLYLRFLFNKP